MKIDESGIQPCEPLGVRASRDNLEMIDPYHRGEMARFRTDQAALVPSQWDLIYSL